MSLGEKRPPFSPGVDFPRSKMSQLGYRGHSFYGKELGSLSILVHLLLREIDPQPCSSLPSSGLCPERTPPPPTTLVCKLSKSSNPKPKTQNPSFFCLFVFCLCFCFGFCLFVFMFVFGQTFSAMTRGFLSGRSHCSQGS